MNNSRPGKPAGTNTDDEQTLFREMVPGVSALKQDRVAPYRPARKPDARQRLRDEQKVMDELLGDSDDDASFGSGDELSWLKDGCPPKLLRHLRRGRYTVQAEIDLHGHTVLQAKQALHEFLQDCAARQLGCVRVIHGKGLGSPGRTPVIKGKVLRWLSRNGDVIAVCSAPARDGGTGAVFVLLRH
jgi:DNA-nicking Smr family endonuclease